MKNLFLKATVHNWGMICLINGDWLSETWNIYDDGSFRKVRESGRKQSAEEFMKNRMSGHGRATVKRASSGRMPPESFEKLKNAVLRDPWPNPGITTDGCDGVAWEIEQYAPDGTVERSNGGPAYIYGHRNLEEITGLLPGNKACAG